jgi:MFS transporter, FHS family, L-fucose permease
VHKSEESAAPRDQTFALGVLTSLFFMWGFCTCLNDILFPLLKKIFALSYTAATLIQFVFFGSYFVLSLAAARLIERVGYKAAIVTGLLVMAAGALIFVPAAGNLSYTVFLCGLFVLAGGITVLQVAANPYVVVLGPEKTASARLNLSQAFNSLATFVAPVFGSIFILSRTRAGTSAANSILSAADRSADAAALQLPYGGIALVLVLLAAVVWLTRLPVIPTHPQTRAEACDSLWRHKNLVMGAVAIFVYVGAEVSIGNMLINYLSSPHISQMTAARAAGYLSVYWGGAMLGRFVIGAAAMRYMTPSKILADNSVAAVLMVGISIVSHGALAMWAILLVGLCNSIMFPTIFALAVKGLGPLTGRGSGVLIMAIFGGAVVPMLQAVLADVLGLTVSFVIPMLCYGYIWLFALKTFVDPRPKSLV